MTAALNAACISWKMKIPAQYTVPMWFGRYLDTEQCQCTEYLQRSILVPECVTLSMDNLEQVYYMPSSCAYRLLADGKKTARLASADQRQSSVSA